MSFLGGGFSRILAAFSGGGQSAESIRAQEVPTGDRQYSWGMGQLPDSDLAGPEAAQALGPPDASLTHKGTLALSGQLPREDRGYSAHGGDDLLHPTPPLNPPAITRGILEVSNAADGTGSEMGDQGFAVRVPSGIACFEDGLWGIQWMHVTAVGRVEDRLADELASGRDTYYYYADGYKCDDAKGRDESDTPVRIFFANENSLPAVCTMAGYIRDTKGIAWGITGGGGGGGRKLWGKATQGWVWVTGYTNAVGRVAFNPCDDEYGNNPDSTRTYSAFLRAGSGTDPNVQPNDIFGYGLDVNDTRIVCTAGAYDDKIGMIKRWGGTLANIPGGWKLVTNAAYGAGRFTVGYKEGTDYDPPGTMGGSATVTPTAHTSGDDQWHLHTHASQTVSTEVTGITVDDHAAQKVSTCASLTVSNELTNLTVDPHDSQETSNDTSGISIDDHVWSHKHHATTVSVLIDHVGGASWPDPTGQTDDAVGCPDSSMVHYHDIQVDYGEVWKADESLSALRSWTAETSQTLAHTVNDSGHSHTTPVLEHTVQESSHNHTSPPHDHTIPTLEHTVNDNGHNHTTPALSHTGWIGHHEQDFRPPWVAVIEIIRVGPDDD